MIRIVLGFMAAPLLPALMAWAVQRLIPDNPSVIAVVFLALFSPVVAVPATIVFAIPLFFVLRRRQWLGLHHLVLAGACIGLASTLIIVLVGASTQFLFSAVAFVPFGMVMASIFWLVAYWKPRRAPVA